MNWRAEYGRRKATTDEIETARAFYEDDSQIEIDDDAVVIDINPGLWVSAWVFIEREDL